jgi:TetR/AcrR family transcriptional regulator, transcriptional repressor for nem operon
VTKAEKTRQFIIEQTAPVFNRKGFAGTSISDLTETTGLTKGALYGHFENKDQIASEAFQYAVNKVRQLVRDRIRHADSYKSQLLSLIGFYSEYVFSPPVAGGCPLLNASVEVDDDHPSMRSVVVNELTQTVLFIQSLIDSGIKTGEFSRQVNSRQLAYTLFCMIEGAIMFSRAEQSREPMDIISKHCTHLLNQISNHNTNEQTT